MTSKRGRNLGGIPWHVSGNNAFTATRVMANIRVHKTISKRAFSLEIFGLASHLLGQATAPASGRFEIHGSTVAAEVTANSAHPAEFFLRDRLLGRTISERPGMA